MNKTAYRITFIALLLAVSVTVRFVDDGKSDINFVMDWSVKDILKGVLTYIGIETVSKWVGRMYFIKAKGIEIE